MPSQSAASGSTHSPFPARARSALAVLTVTGQIAWAVENLWFTTFVPDELTPTRAR